MLIHTVECFGVFQNDRPKAQKAMEATWSTMEKKEKIMWIKKAAEDQKRYEVRCHLTFNSPLKVSTLLANKLSPTHRGTCARCAHRQPLWPQGRR